jgi:hypothetical protein
LAVAEGGDGSEDDDFANTETGEDGDAGSVAVLDAAGTELAVVDKAGAVASVSSRPSFAAAFIGQ